MMSDRINARNISDSEFFYGHKACAGCGGSLAVRIALKVLGENTLLVEPAGCMSAVSFNYPQMSFANNAIISAFAGTGAVMSGLKAGAEAMGLKDYHVLGIAGDGGTADIGIQALSGLIDRNDDVIYICYDNEAYMNTGIQKSGLTPFGATTTTTPARSKVKGNIRPKKNLFEIVAAHGIPYAATASVGYIEDFANKVKRASEVKGTSFIHVLAPCPTGWGVDTSETIDIAREIVDTGLWYLAEYYDGEMHLNMKPKALDSVSHYIKRQGRFKHLSDEDIDKIIRERDKTWERIAVFGI
ncbi:pyruvate ferredoxin oxidoreductase beta subunit [Lachnospiraceae bacterium NE2001]|nr:pyruvate ferredoxin oxidoreductase beta subunit [Lachnospiraceae bacterium NE2001]